MNQLQVDAVLDASFLSSFDGQIREPDHGDPVFEVRGADILVHFPLLWSHEPCGDNRTKSDAAGKKYADPLS